MSGQTTGERLLIWTMTVSGFDRADIARRINAKRTDAVHGRDRVTAFDIARVQAHLGLEDNTGCLRSGPAGHFMSDDVPQSDPVFEQTANGRDAASEISEAVGGGSSDHHMTAPVIPACSFSVAKSTSHTQELNDEN